MAHRELDILQRIGQHLADPSVLAHDAFFDPAGRGIYTTDMLIEGNHFDMRYFSPEDLGWKAAAVNISDIAATGGRLRFLLVSLGLPEGADMSFIDGFYKGLGEAAKTYDGLVVGGDTVSADRITVNVTAVGVLPEGHKPGRRHQARPGDRIIATGFHGLSAVGLQVLQQDLPGYVQARQAHLRPSPCIAEGVGLSARFDRYAMMDSSDGLADAALKLAHASGVSIVLEAGLLPVHPEVSQYAEATKANPMDLLLYGGEDFQLVAAIEPVEHLAEGWHIIGTVSEPEHGEPGAWLREDDALTLLDLSRTYQHFKEEKA